MIGNLCTDFSETNVIHDNGVELKVIAPVPETIDGRLMCRWFDDKDTDIGKTKNGHSVVVIATIGRMKVLLGGDLNSNSADYLTLEDIVKWWYRGTFLLNTIFISCVIIHLTIIVTVFENGWIFLLLVPIAFIGLLLNLLFVSGLFAEILLTKVLRIRTDFNKWGPTIKKLTSIICIFTIILLSLLDFINRSN